MVNSIFLDFDILKISSKLYIMSSLVEKYFGNLLHQDRVKIAKFFYIN